MSIYAAIFTRLTTHAGLSALVGTRVFPVRLAQDPTYPCIRYTRVSTPRVMAHSGYGGLAVPRWQFDIYTDDPDDGDAVAKQLRIALYGLHDTVEGVRVDAGLPENDIDDYDEVREKYRRIVDIVLWHAEEVA